MKASKAAHEAWADAWNKYHGSNSIAIGRENSIQAIQSALDAAEQRGREHHKGNTCSYCERLGYDRGLTKAHTETKCHDPELCPDCADLVNQGREKKRAVESKVCRSCGYEATTFFSLGEMPLANALLATPGDPAPRFPLELAFCPACTLVQLVETVPQAAMFTTYDYLSACCPPVEAQAAGLVKQVCATFTPNFVVEIGSNDGYLLSHYPESTKKLGIEPAWNVLQHARRDRQIPTLWEFFSEKTARMVVQLAGQADVIHANNVLAHCPDLNDFMRGIAVLLKPGGICVVEVPWVKNMIENGDFSSVYHEHVYYFSIAALNSLIVRHGLRLGHADHIGAQGGSLRLWIYTEGGNTEALLGLLIEEAFVGAHTAAFYQRFADHAKDLLFALQEIDFESQHIVGFGAPAKATVMLNLLPQWFSERLGYTVDDTPEKQGRFIPGVRLPIHPVSQLLADKPDAVFVLCWNHRQAVIDRLRREGYAGRFIFPLPKLEVVS